MTSLEIVFDYDGNIAGELFKWGFRASAGERKILFILPSANIRLFLGKGAEFMNLEKLTDEQRNKIHDAIKANFTDDDLGNTSVTDIEMELPINP